MTEQKRDTEETVAHAKSIIGKLDQTSDTKLKSSKVFQASITGFLILVTVLLAVTGGYLASKNDVIPATFNILFAVFMLFIVGLRFNIQGDTKK